MSKNLVDDYHLKTVKMEATREGFSRGLRQAGQLNSSVVALCADLTDSTKMNLFAEEFPERFVQVGVAEQNLVTVASGMAAMGKIPFAASYAAFSPGRNWEQIRTTICLNQANVKIVGSHAGVSVGADGATHQMLEDIALMRVLPNMLVVAPADSIEAEKATLAIAEHDGPAYIRLAREATPVFTTQETPFALNKAQVFYQGTDVTILATGSMTFTALVAAERLAQKGIRAEVVHVPVIKPLDRHTILDSLKKTGLAVSVEEAQISGGFGGAIAELITDNYPVRLVRVGINDHFGESGRPDQLMEAFGLTSAHITEKVMQLIREVRSK